MTQPDLCPNCQHPQHLPGAECATPVHHGPSRFHLCLCLARPGAANACPPQMTCQGGTLGYSDIWYLQHGHSLSSEDGVISPEVLTTGPVSVGFPSRGDDEPAGVAPATDQTGPSRRVGLRDEIVKALGQIKTIPPVAHRREQADHVLAVLYREWPWLRAEAEEAAPDQPALRDRIAEALRPHASLGGTPLRWELPFFDGATPSLPRISGWRPLDDVVAALAAVLPASVDRADVLRALADQQTQLAVADDLARRRDMATARRELVRELRRVAAETPNTTEGEPGCAHCGGPHDWDDCEAYTKLAAAEQPTAPTLCGPVPDECSDEPCANHEREQAHAEGEHCFCGPECDEQPQPKEA